MASAPCQLYRPQWRRNYGDRGVHCTPKFRTCTPCIPSPQVKDAAYMLFCCICLYVKIFSERL